MKEETIILGAGFSGLAAGIKTKAPIYEAQSFSGGTCSPYYKKGYKFNRAGGHWIFGSDPETLNFINSLSPLNFYKRSSAVFFPEKNLFIPYPIQNHLNLFPSNLRNRITKEIQKGGRKVSKEDQITWKKWLELKFGSTLCRLFFFPFHQAYTDGLYHKIASQDHFKTPLKPSVGYNPVFYYPQKGLGDLIQKMARRCQVHFKKQIIKINLAEKEVYFKDGTRIKFQKIISTLPLRQMVELSDLKVGTTPDPYTSILVVNLGAKKGKKCPKYHWLYLPNSKAGAYRVGFYSNIDKQFLSFNKKGSLDKASLYVEKAFREGSQPTKEKNDLLIKNIIKELQEWQFIEKPEVVDSNWIEFAYTWRFPDSNWRQDALSSLKQNNVFQIGRYGSWRFQGILDSIKEGLEFNPNIA